MTIAIAGAAAVLFAPGAGAQDVTARLGHAFAVGSPIDQASRAFAERVAEVTGGAVEITVFPDSQLGGDEAMARDLARGGLELAFLNPGSLTGLDPLLDFHYLPYVASNFEEADALFYDPDGILQTTLREAMRANGFEPLAFYELEFRAVTNSERPIREVADLQGLKIRVPGSQAIRGVFEQAGAQPVTMPFPELFVALQQGTVSGQDNGASITYNSRLFEAQPHMTLTNHVYAMGAVTAASGFWDGLTQDQRDAVTRVAEEVTAEQIAANREQNARFLQQIREGGTEVIELTDAQMEGFIALGDAVWDSLTPIYGAERIEALRAEIAALRQ
jgi:tripartite ATP-independent transporter DctP family solute receptor